MALVFVDEHLGELIESLLIGRRIDRFRLAVDEHGSNARACIAEQFAQNRPIVLDLQLRPLEDGHDRTPPSMPVTGASNDRNVAKRPVLCCCDS